MKKRIMKLLCGVLGLLFLTVPIFAADGGTLVWGKSKDAIALDPGTVDEGNSSMVISQICEGLLTYKPGTTEIIPNLAESFSVSKDGLEVTFKLRKNVKFHDGTPLNADAVVFSLKRQNDKTHPFNQHGPWKYWSSKSWAATDKGPGLIKDIVKVEDATVKIILNKPDATVMYNFALYFTSIVSPTAAQKYGADFKKHPVGTGPFQFGEWVKDDHIILKRFEGYWGPKAHLDNVIFKVYPDEQARVLALKKGEADIIDPPGLEAMKTIEADANLKMVSGNILSIGYLALNCETGPLAKKELRQALGHAVNRKEILDVVYGKLGVAEKLPLPSLIWGYDKSIPDYAYDPEKAKAILKTAGATTPVKLNILYLPAYRPYNPNGQKVAEIMQAQLKSAGFEAEIKTFDMGTYWDNVDAGKFDVAMTGWSGEGDPDDFLYTLFTAGYLNSSRWNNQKYVDLVTKAKMVYTQQERAKLYMQAEKVLMDEAPILMLARGVQFQPMNKKVEGFIIYPTTKLVLAHVWLQK